MRYEYRESDIVAGGIKLNVLARYFGQVRNVGKWHAYFTIPQTKQIHELFTIS